MARDNRRPHRALPSPARGRPAPLPRRPRPPRPRPGALALAPGHDDRPVPARRRRRYRRPARGRGAVADAGPAGRRREQGRRRRRHRHGPGGQGQARRLYAAAGAVVDHDPAARPTGCSSARRCTSSGPLQPIARFTADPTVLVVRADSPWQDRRRRSSPTPGRRPGSITFGSSGNLRHHARADGDAEAGYRHYMLHVPYTGAGPGHHRPARRAGRRARHRPGHHRPACQGREGCGRSRTGATGRLAALPDVPSLTELRLKARSRSGRACSCRPARRRRWSTRLREASRQAAEDERAGQGDRHRRLAGPVPGRAAVRRASSRRREDDEAPWWSVSASSSARVGRQATARRSRVPSQLTLLPSFGESYMKTSSSPRPAAPRFDGPGDHLRRPCGREEARRRRQEQLHHQVREGRGWLCETQAAEKKLAGAAKNSFVKKCASDHADPQVAARPTAASRARGRSSQPRV